MVLEKYYQFSDIRWKLVATYSDVTENLNADFKIYQIEQASKVDFEIQIIPQSSPEVVYAKKIKGKNYYFDWKWKKRNFKFDQDLYGYEEIKEKRTLIISGKNHNRLREVVLSYVLSVIGEIQDLKGWHRLHAFGICRNTYAVVVPLDSGNGKSSFTYWIFNNSQLKILSDETVLTNGSEAIGLFNRLSLRYEPNTTYELYKRANSEVKYLVPLPIGRISTDQLPIQLWLPQNKWTKWQFLYSFSLGLGNAQMLEFMFRADNILSLARIFLKRLVVGVQLLNRIKTTQPWNSEEIQNFESLKKI